MTCPFDSNPLKQRAASLDDLLFVSFIMLQYARGSVFTELDLRIKILLCWSVISSLEVIEMDKSFKWKNFTATCH